MKNDDRSKTPRRAFLGTIAAGAASLGISTLASPLSLSAAPLGSNNPADADAWFEKVKGKHRVVFDVPAPNGVMPFAWPRVFMMTNASTGTPENDVGVVVVLRHNGIPFAMEDSLWVKYKFGEVFNIKDDQTNAPAVRNRFWKPNPGYSIPGVGPVPVGINDLQDSGAMFCVCNMAITVFSAVVAQKMNMKHEDVMKDWLSGILPGVQVVPSGVWAVGRAQEHKCAYCYAG